MRAGIIGIGMYAPDEVRTNDWWPRDVVDSWRRAKPPPPAAVTPGMQCVIDAAAEVAEDPFQGVVERRVLEPALTHVDMEERAAREAIARAGIDASAIDIVLTHPVVPRYGLMNPAVMLHERLGLRAECLAMYVEATSYAVFGQLALAEAAIAAGRARYALLVQSCTATRLVDRASPYSAILGDAATALVLGPVTDGGLLAFAHYTDGRYPDSLVLDGDRLVVHPQQLAEAQIQIADVCKRAVDTALARSGYGISDVGFLGVFQGTAWLHRAVATHLGASHARSVEVFRRFGYLSAAAVSACLYIGQDAGRLLRDDVVVLTGGGTGMTYGAAVLRWGKA